MTNNPLDELVKIMITFIHFEYCYIKHKIRVQKRKTTTLSILIRYLILSSQCYHHGRKATTSIPSLCTSRIMIQNQVIITYLASTPWDYVRYSHSTNVLALVLNTTAIDF